MDLVLLIVPVALVALVILAWQISSHLKRIADSNELAIKCLDAHEDLLRKIREETDRQGADIEAIKDSMLNR
ncbi:hypothetical protein [Buttiauxella sp.]|uniref:hypothetical protein n=1 Tax=Buttiauxella sp. TaxID=1972222 RepID=UPI003C72C976